MDAMVSARVPVEIKKRGDAKLKEMGSSATELINSAYDFLLKNNALPGADSAHAVSESQTKVLSGEEARLFKEQWSTRSVLTGRGYNGENFKELLDQARGECYARLA